MYRTSPDTTREPGRQHCRRLLFIAASLALLIPVEPAAAQFHSLVDELVIAAVKTPNAPTQPAGGDVTDGVRDAVAVLNAQGGVLGKMLRVTEYADDCSEATGASIASRIAVEGAAVVVGHVCSSAALAAAPLYAKNATIMISPGARHPKLTDSRAGPTIFRLSPRDDRFGRDTAAMIVARYPGKRVALVNDRSLEARTLSDDMTRALQRSGVQVVHRDSYVSGEREYNALVQRMIAQNADIVVIPAQPIEARIIFTRWLELNPNAVLVGSQLQTVPESEALARQVGERFIVMQPSDWRTPTGNDQQQQPSAIRNRARAALEAWAQAAKDAGTTASAPVAEKLAAGFAATNLGPLRFDSKGDAEITSFTPHVWRGQGWSPLDARP